MSYWVKTYGPGEATAVAVDRKGDILVTGEIKVEDGERGFLARLNRSGNVKWFKVGFGGCGLKTSSKSIFVGGGCSVLGGIGTLYRLDKEGNAIWYMYMSLRDWDYSSKYHLHTFSVQDNDEVIFAGYLEVSPRKSSARITDNAWILSMNRDGVVNWQRVYGKKDSMYRLNDVYVTSRGGIVAVGSEGRKGGIWVLKLDRKGNIEWQRLYDAPYYGTAVTMTSDEKNIIVIGNELRGRSKVLCLDLNGEVKWSKYIAKDLNSVASTPEGDIVVVGRYGLIFKIDKTGEIKWQMSLGHSRYDKLNDVTISPEGDIVVVGSTKNDEIWVSRIPPDGRLADCTFCKVSNESMYQIESKFEDTNCSLLKSMPLKVTLGYYGSVPGSFRSRMKDSINIKLPYSPKEVSYYVKDLSSISTSFVKLLNVQPNTLYYIESEKDRELNIQEAVAIDMPPLVEETPSFIRFSIMNNFADSLKLAIDLRGNEEIFEFDRDVIEFPELKLGSKISKSLGIAPMYAGTFEFKVRLKAIVDGIEIETAKVIPVEVAERGSQVYTPQASLGSQQVVSQNVPMVEKPPQVSSISSGEEAERELYRGEVQFRTGLLSDERTGTLVITNKKLTLSGKYRLSGNLITVGLKAALRAAGVGEVEEVLPIKNIQAIQLKKALFRGYYLEVLAWGKKYTIYSKDAQRIYKLLNEIWAKTQT